MMKNAISKPFQLIIFGATGDLARLKLFPAIYELFIQKKLPKHFSVIGFGRTALSQSDFWTIFQKSIEQKHREKVSPQALADLLKSVTYFSGQYDQLEDFKKLFLFAESMATDPADLPLKLAYFSVPPNVFEPIINNLAAVQALKQPWSTKTKTQPEQNFTTQILPLANLKLILEKPFGYDAKSASALFQLLSGHFATEQIYLLDHYLGKRPIQDLLRLRMENNVINLMLKGQEIANIQITALEKADVGQRIGYFDQVGLMKDMVQSHLLQILSLITMDIPITPSVASLQREKNNILSAVRFSGNSEDVVFGQYDSYKKVEGVSSTSTTDTFSALRLFIDRRDWFNVPIYIRSGKKLNESKTSVVIEFKKMPFQNQIAAPNRLIFEFKPEEKIKLQLIQDQDNNFNFFGCEPQTLELAQSLQKDGEGCLSEYANLILDVLQDKKVNFLSFEEILAAWKVIDEVENLRKNGIAQTEIYADYSEGPFSYLSIPKRDGFIWYE